MINILIRLHDDIDKFYKTISSIEEQTYKDINIIVSVDKKEIYKFIAHKLPKYKYIYIDPSDIFPGIPNDEIDINCQHKNKNIFGSLFIPNIYFNIMHQYTKIGYILYLDVGDVVLDKNMFLDLQTYRELNYNILWKTMVKNNRIIPQDWNGYPVLCDIDSSSIMFPTSLIQNWTGYRRGDFRVIKKICQQNSNIFIPKIYIQKDSIQIL